MAKSDYQFYSADDMQAAISMLNLHMAKLQKSANANDWPKCCAALRAIDDECSNANRIAAALSAKTHAPDPRMGRASIGGQNG